MESVFKDIYDLWSKSHDENLAITEHKRLFQEKKIEQPTISKLRKMHTEAKLDLHSLTLNEALKKTDLFINECWNNGLRKIKIVTGKGIHSLNGEPVIRPEILHMLGNHSRVREFNKKPKAVEGGSGVIVVILKE